MISASRSVLTLAVALAGGVGVWQYLNRTGFCYATLEYTKKQTLIENAIAYHADKVAQRFPQKIEFDWIDWIERQNNCCNIKKNAADFAILGGAFGLGHIVDLNYRLPDFVSKDGAPRYMDAFVIEDSCGKAYSNFTAVNLEPSVH